MQWFRDELSVTALALQVLQLSTPGSNLFASLSPETLQEFVGTEQTLPPSHPEDTERFFFSLKKKTHKTAFHAYVRVQNKSVSPQFQAE